MSTLRLPAKKAPPAPPAPTPPLAPAKAKAPERMPEEKAERARDQAKLERQAHLEASRRRDQHIRSGLVDFRGRWPELFGTPVPLAVGVGPQIRAEMPEMAYAQFRAVMRFWTHTTVYLQAVAAGVERRNLDGSLAGVPAEDQQEFARDMLRQRGKWPVEEVQDAVEPAGPAGHPGGDPT